MRWAVLLLTFTITITFSWGERPERVLPAARTTDRSKMTLEQWLDTYFPTKSISYEDAEMFGG
jgi:hypothetical protein